MALRDVTPEKIAETVALCDEIGESEFLARHGYRPSLVYRLVVDGKSYPSKAILGVAAGLTARQFSGGAAHTARVLNRLGFEVRKVVRR